MAGEKIAVRERLASIAAAHGGRLTAQDVVDDARDPASPLHDEFEWDDQTLIREALLERARTLIRSVRVTITTEKLTLSSVAFVRDPSADTREQGYIAVTALREQSHAQRREAIEYECRGALAALRRAREVATAIGLEQEVDGVLQRLAGLLEEVQAA